MGPFIIRPVIFFVVSILHEKMPGKSRGVKKKGESKAIHTQSTEMVISFYSFMKKEAYSS
jgi:hypothetical protein